MFSRQLISIVVFFVTLAIGLVFIDIYHGKSQQEQQRLLSQLAFSEAAFIERRLSYSLSSTYILAQEVRVTAGHFPHFDQYAADVMNWVGGVSNLQLAPNGIIERVYPLTGNEEAIGHNILVDDRRKDEALLAIKERMLTLAGPFELIQGGVAVIGRNPVFLRDQNGEHFWGFTSALIFLEELFGSISLRSLEDKGYSFTLSKQDGVEKIERIFLHSENKLQGLVGQSIVNVPNAKWILRVGQKPTENIVFLYVWFFCLVITAVLLALLTYRALREPARLRQLVVAKTEELKYLAFHDPLTDLASRRLLQEEIETRLPLVKKESRYLALLYIDIDDFKRINDTMGHDTGDYVLKEIAARMNSAVSDTDITARLGGDEFAVLLTSIYSTQDAAYLASRLNIILSEGIQINNRQLVVTSSIGIAIAPDDAGTADELLLKADLALYASKNRGKNQHAFYDQEMQNNMITRLDIEEGVRNGLLKDQFFLVFQPIVSFNSQQVVKYEALVRWRHPEKGVLSPDYFIDISEQTGLIIPLGKVVLRKACEFINHSMTVHNVSPVVTINVSSRQFLDENFVADVKRVVKRMNVDSTLIQFEITESAVMEDVSRGVKIMQQLKADGFLFLMDDFGTGHSSFSQLRQLPVSTLKVDRSFVADIEIDKNDYQIVSAIIAMALQLDLEVIAEGVETEEQLHLLKQAGCLFGQGYFFSRPLEEKNIVLDQMAS